MIALSIDKLIAMLLFPEGLLLICVLLAISLCQTEAFKGYVDKQQHDLEIVAGTCLYFLVVGLIMIAVIT